MSAVFSSQDVEHFTPDSYKVDGAIPADAPVYLLAPMTWKERARWRAQLATEGVRFPQDEEFVKAVRQAIEDVAPSNSDELLAIVQAYDDLPKQPLLAKVEGETEDEAKARAEEAADRLAVTQPYEAVIDKLRQHPLIGNLIGLRTLFYEMAPPMAAAICLRGWKQVSMTFERVNGSVPDRLLEQIVFSDLIAIGNHAMTMQAVSAAQRGN